MEDELLEFSGESPNHLDPVLMDTVLVNSDVSNFTGNTTLTLVQPATTMASLLPYLPNYYRIGTLAAKCILSLLLCVLSATIKRDFLKVFALMLIQFILLECVFDIYTEIQTSITHHGSRDLVWSLPPRIAPDQILDLQSKEVTIYQELLTQYTTYNFYRSDYKTLRHIQPQGWHEYRSLVRNDPSLRSFLLFFLVNRLHASLFFLTDFQSANSVFALISFIIADLIFWSTLFSSIVAFYYAHKAVVRPEEINYIPYANAFLRMQIFPILFTIIDTLVASYKVPPYVVLGSTVIIRLAACLVAVVLFTQALASVIVFCRRRDEYTKSSPYDQVRFGKRRLFSFILFQIVVQAFAVPYLIWAAVSLVQDFLITFNFSKEDEKSLPLEMAAELYVEHLRIFLIRPLVVLVAILVFIAPYRKKFIRFFCPCCRQ